MRILITGGNGFLAKEIKNLLKDKDKYTIESPNKKKLNLLDKNNVKDFFLTKDFYDAVIHTAITGGSRNSIDTYETFYNNVKMFFNLMEYKNKFGKLINLASGASYDRNTNIFSDKNILTSNPDDYYGFSKNIIERIVLTTEKMYNVRIFNVFSKNEMDTRFIKMCINCLQNNKDIIIDNDRYFDFFYMDDFIKVLLFYMETENSKLHKDIDLFYEIKYKLCEIDSLIKKDNNNIKIKIQSTSLLNYIGNHEKLYSYPLMFEDFENILKRG
jgi:nucleoside-diphosphate-sugar epimerase